MYATKKIKLIGKYNERVVDENFQEIGDLVGYHVGMEKKWHKQKTKLVFCTPGVLLTQMAYDPEL